MSEKSQNDVATKDKKGVLKDLIETSWMLIRESLMAKDPVLEAATEFGKRLREGKVRLLPKEESDRDLETVRTEQRAMRKKLAQVREKLNP